MLSNQKNPLTNQMKVFMKNISKSLVAIGVALVLQSCFVAKDYKRPQVKTDDLYRTETAADDTTSLAQVSWDKMFTDAKLQELIRKGIQNNLDYKIALQNIEAARANFAQGKSGYLPTLSLGADWTHQILSKETQFGRILQNHTVDQYQLTGNLSWEADIWGKIRSAKRGAQAQYLQSVAGSQVVQTQVVSGIASMYFQLMALDAQLEVVQSTLDNRNKSVEVIKSLKESGYTNEVGVKQTEGQLYQTQIIAEELKTNIILLENSLRLLMGESSGAIVRGKLADQVLNPEIKTGIPTQLLNKRPDVIAAEYNLVNQFELTNVARSNFYPSFRITATGGFQSIDLKEWFSTNALFANFVTGLTQPILNGRRIRTAHEIAKSNQEKAYLEFQKSLLVAGKEVSDALQKYENETTKLELRTKHADALDKAANYSDELLQYGMVNYLEVLTAKDQALNSKLELINTKYGQYNAIIQLYKALGGGW